MFFSNTLKNYGLVGGKKTKHKDTVTHPVFSDWKTETREINKQDLNTGCNTLLTIIFLLQYLICCCAVSIILGSIYENDTMA